VFAWEGGATPIWCKDERGTPLAVKMICRGQIDDRSIQGGVLRGMRLICTLNADLSALARALQITTGLRGKRFYRVDYGVCVYFGGTQLRAKLQWKERVSTSTRLNPFLLTESQGVLREGPVTVMPYVS
jgi:hypothetical protein